VDKELLDVNRKIVELRKMEAKQKKAQDRLKESQASFIILKDSQAKLKDSQYSQGMSLKDSNPMLKDSNPMLSPILQDNDLKQSMMKEELKESNEMLKASGYSDNQMQNQILSPDFDPLQAATERKANELRKEDLEKQSKKLQEEVDRLKKEVKKFTFTEENVNGVDYVLVRADYVKKPEEEIVIVEKAGGRSGQKKGKGKSGEKESRLANRQINSRR
jgi:hypothetical protein